MMMPPQRRRASDDGWLWTAWVSLPLVDRRTGEWSLSRTMATAFAAATIRWMSDLRAKPVTWEVVTLVTLMACVALAAAFGKDVFHAVATRIAGRGPQPEQSSQ